MPKNTGPKGPVFLLDYTGKRNFISRRFEPADRYNLLLTACENSGSKKPAMDGSSDFSGCSVVAADPGTEYRNRQPHGPAVRNGPITFGATLPRRHFQSY